MEPNVDIPVPRTRAGGLHGFNPGTGSSQRSEVQNADIPVPRALDFRGNPRGFHHGQSSSGFRGAERHDVFGSLLHDYGLEDEEEDVEDEDMESVEEFDESLDRFEHSGWRPMRLCTSYYSGGCARGWECTFAQGEQELHPRALS